MSKAIKIQILKTIEAGRSVSLDRFLDGSVDELLCDGLADYINGAELIVTDAGRAFLAEEAKRAEAAKAKARRGARARSAAMTSVGMKRTPYGWE